MRFNVAQLLKEPVGATRQYDFAEESFDLGDDLGRARVEGHFKATRTSRGLLVSGWVKGNPQLMCSRCLEPYRPTVESTFDEEFVPTIDVRTGQPVAAPQEEEENFFFIDHNHEIDLSDLVRQYIVLAFPMQPLCQEACAGLCPQCGANLNKAPCSCEPIPPGSPLADLEDLLHEE